MTKLFMSVVTTAYLALPFIVHWIGAIAANPVNSQAAQEAAKRV